MPYDVHATFGFLDLADLGAAAATVLLDDGHVGATYELASRVATVAELAAEAGVTAERIDDPGTHPWLSAMFAYYDRHGLPVGTLPLRALLGPEPVSCCCSAGRQLRDQPAQEGVLAAGLQVDPAGAGQVADQALAGEERRLPVADLAHVVLDAVGPRDHVAGVDRVGLAGLQVDRVDRAVARQHQVALAGDAQHEEALAGEEGLAAAPLGVDLDAARRREVGAGLHEERAVERPVHDVAGERRARGRARRRRPGR